MRFRLAAIALAGSSLSVATVAQAQWYRADSPHFIVYSEGREADVRSAAERLEKLDLAQRVMTGTPMATNPVRPVIYMLPSISDVAGAFPFGGGSGVAGFYSASTRGPYMVTPRDAGNNGGFTATGVLYHELTHHFMYQNHSAAYPAWFSEGFAELLGTAKIKDDRIVVGDLASSRYDALHYFDWLPVRKLVASRNYGDVDNVFLLYTEGWLLTHYLTIGGGRDGQLATYLAGINAGKSPAKAAEAAFGDLTKLDNELQAYVRKRTLSTRIITFKSELLPKVTVSAVSPGQSALMLHDMRLSVGIPAAAAGAFATEVRGIAARYPSDPFAYRIRAEADRLAGDNADLLAASQAWIAVAPKDPLAMTFLAVGEMNALAAAKNKEPAAWGKARARMAAAYRLSPDQPIILRAYYDSYRLQGITPPVSAQNVLYHALDLIPNDGEVRYELAQDFEQRGMISDAIATISVAAFDSADDDAESPKQKAKREKREAKYKLAGDIDHETAREMLHRLEAKAKATPAAGAAPAKAD